MAAQPENGIRDQEPASTAAPDSPRLSRKERRGRWVESLSALLLGLATLATAWSAYQAARWAGAQSTLYADGLGMMVESTQVSTAANQLAQIDAAMFMHYVKPYAAGDEALVSFYYERFRPEFQFAVDAWLATDPLHNPDAPAGPFQIPAYRVSLADKASQLAGESASVFAKGKEANQHSDDYILNAVILASVLFLAGIAPRFDWPPIPIAIFVMATIVLIIGLYNLATLPVH